MRLTRRLTRIPRKNQKAIYEGAKQQRLQNCSATQKHGEEIQCQCDDAIMMVAVNCLGDGRGGCRASRVCYSKLLQIRVFQVSCGAAGDENKGTQV